MCGARCPLQPSTVRRPRFSMPGSAPPRAASRETDTGAARRAPHHGPESRQKGEFWREIRARAIFDLTGSHWPAAFPPPPVPLPPMGGGGTLTPMAESPSPPLGAVEGRGEAGDSRVATSARIRQSDNWIRSHAVGYCSRSGPTGCLPASPSACEAGSRRGSDCAGPTRPAQPGEVEIGEAGDQQHAAALPWHPPPDCRRASVSNSAARRPTGSATAAKTVEGAARPHVLGSESGLGEKVGREHHPALPGGAGGRAEDADQSPGGADLPAGLQRRA